MIHTLLYSAHFALHFACLSFILSTMFLTVIVGGLTSLNGTESSFHEIKVGRNSFLYLIVPFLST
jgi:hypothetical protein